MKSEPTDILVSFDIISLFTNISTEDAIPLLAELGLQKDIVELVKLYLSMTYFLYDGKYYEQKNGRAMGSPLSPVIANSFMEAFEEEAIGSSDMKSKCWLRYVDDTFVIWQNGEEKLQQFLEHINSQHPAITFTMEKEQNGNLPFLDIMVKKTEEGILQYAVFRKKTHTDRYLQARSHHHPMQKKTSIQTLLSRAEPISDEQYLASEKIHLGKILKKNGY